MALVYRNSRVLESQAWGWRGGEQIGVEDSEGLEGTLRAEGRS